MKKAFSKLFREAVRLVDASREYGRPGSIARRYRHLYFERRFSPDEIRFFRLLDPSLDSSDLACFVSKEELLAVQRELNRSGVHDWTEDKLEFHRRCARAGLEVPRLLARCGPDRSLDTGGRVAERPELLPSILDALEEEVVILKPVHGVHGEGVQRLQRTRDGWVDSAGQAITGPGLAQQMAASGYDSWMVQECLVGHPVLQRLSDTDGLQTCRVVTFLRGDGRVEILAARLRLICGPGARDNFSYGRTGNVIANLDIDTGRIVSAVSGSGRDPRIVSVQRHPRTGRELTGFAVPDWGSAVDLAVRAARAFAPLCTVGWDVAIGPDAPRLIEGNDTWDTLSGEPRMGAIYRRLAAECAGLQAESEQAKTRRPAPAHDGAVHQDQ